MTTTINKNLDFFFFWDDSNTCFAHSGDGGESKKGRKLLLHLQHMHCSHHTAVYLDVDLKWTTAISLGNCWGWMLDALASGDFIAWMHFGCLYIVYAKSSKSALIYLRFCLHTDINSNFNVPGLPACWRQTGEYTYWIAKAIRKRNWIIWWTRFGTLTLIYFCWFIVRFEMEYKFIRISWTLWFGVLRVFTFGVYVPFHFPLHSYTE